MDGVDRLPGSNTDRTASPSPQLRSASEDEEAELLVVLSVKEKRTSFGSRWQLQAWTSDGSQRKRLQFGENGTRNNSS